LGAVGAPSLSSALGVRAFHSFGKRPRCYLTTAKILLACPKIDALCGGTFVLPKCIISSVEFVSSQDLLASVFKSMKMGQHTCKANEKMFHSGDWEFEENNSLLILPSSQEIDKASSAKTCTDPYLYSIISFPNIHNTRNETLVKVRAHCIFQRYQSSRRRFHAPVVIVIVCEFSTP
jgi:hypothetical protein